MSVSWKRVMELLLVIGVLVIALGLWSPVLNTYFNKPLLVYGVSTDNPLVSKGQKTAVYYIVERRRACSATSRGFWVDKFGTLVSSEEPRVAGYTSIEEPPHRVAVSVTIPKNADPGLLGYRRVIDNICSDGRYITQTPNIWFTVKDANETHSGRSK